MDINLIKQKVDFGIEPFNWIKPEKITGYKSEEVKKFNFESFQDLKYDGDEIADTIISDYYLECYLRDKNYKLLLEYGLWLITNLYSSSVAYLYPSYIREGFPRDTTIINDIFLNIYSVFNTSCINFDFHSAHLLKIFIFEIFQYGPEWGVYVSTKNKASVTKKMISIEEAGSYNYNFTYLEKDNLTKLSMMEDFNLGDIPVYKY